MSTIEHVADRPEIIIGIDTHSQLHVAVAITTLGQRLDELAFTADRTGYRRLLDWAQTLGIIDRIGIEGTASYGKGLTMWLLAEGLAVIEVSRPERNHGPKTDAIDAEQAARAVLAGTATAIPKAATGPVEQLRTLLIARRSAVKANTAACNQLQAMRVTAPLDLAEHLAGLSTNELVATTAAFRCGDNPAGPTATTKWSMRSLARRVRALTDEIAQIERLMDAVLAGLAPKLLDEFGVSTVTAATLLVAVGDNPDRIDHEGDFAHMTGTAPLDCSSGKQERHRLNRGGNRQANWALHMIVTCRLRHEQRTQDYLERRTADGKTKAEVIRQLKRYVARHIFKILRQNPVLNTELAHAA